MKTLYTRARPIFASSLCILCVWGSSAELFFYFATNVLTPLLLHIYLFKFGSREQTTAALQGVQLKIEFHTINVICNFDATSYGSAGLKNAFYQLKNKTPIDDNLLPFFVYNFFGYKLCINYGTHCILKKFCYSATYEYSYLIYMYILIWKLQDCKYIDQLLHSL